jgi:hypothetical protein
MDTRATDPEYPQAAQRRREKRAGPENRPLIEPVSDWGRALPRNLQKGRNEHAERGVGFAWGAGE